MPGILIVFKDGCYGSTFGVIDAIMVSKGRFRVVIFDDEAFLSDAGKSFSVTGKIRSMYLLDEKSIMLHEEVSARLNRAIDLLLHSSSSCH